MVCAVLDAVDAHPGPDELEVVVAHSPSHVSRHNVGEQFRVDAADPRLRALLEEWGNFGHDPTGDR